MISCSSSTASSAPATSAKVVFGVSLEINFALDLPKLSTREPPPCICDMNSSSRITSTAIGSRLTSRLTKMLSLVTLVSYFGDRARGRQLVELGLQLVRSTRPGTAPGSGRSRCP